jgi:hypothetical protein
LILRYGSFMAIREYDVARLDSEGRCFVQFSAKILPN